MDWRAVVQHVQAILAEINHPPPSCIFYIGITNVPLFRDRPIEYVGPGRHFCDLQRNSVPNHCERATDAVSRDAAANWIQLCCEPVEILTPFCQCLFFEL